jgi:hypothetical protein
MGESSGVFNEVSKKKKKSKKKIIITAISSVNSHPSKMPYGFNLYFLFLPKIVDHYQHAWVYNLSTQVNWFAAHCSTNFWSLTPWLLYPSLVLPIVPCLILSRPTFCFSLRAFFVASISSIFSLL